MTHNCCIIGQQTNVDWICVVLASLVSNETNTDVRIYTWGIYSGRCSHIAVHVVSEILNGILTGLYTLTTIGRERWESS